MPESRQQSLRIDCLSSLADSTDLAAKLVGHRIAVIGGTGFLGSWLAETVSALNDDLGSRVRIDVMGRSASEWIKRHSHLRRPDVSIKTVDVRSSIELAGDTTLVVYAAGVADPRLHASDPHQVFQTSVDGIGNALAATSRLESIHRFVNVSSGLVLGDSVGGASMTESDVGILDFTRFHNVYAEARRAAEALVTIYSGQYRIPVTTARAFTFLGPYQSLHAPWAVNNFMRDALSGQDIRIHGDGTTRRSYLYGSDAAVWLIRILLDGVDNGIYNIGGNTAVSHSEAAAQVAELIRPVAAIVHKTQPAARGRNQHFLPDVGHTMRSLRVRQFVQMPAAIQKSMRWHAERLGCAWRMTERSLAA